ncbi:cysteine dioxygenase [Dyella sp.]|uniref:cysteine dioxygenase n=1 Tax=Dyella sp. TaxID=1869338 RepID=UPI003F7D8D79
MHDAIVGGTDVWTHRVLAAIARSLGAGGRGDVAALAAVLAQSPWWEGCPSASSVERYRRLSLRPPQDSDDYAVLLIAWPPGHATPIHDHDGLWGIELVLDGVLQVEAFSIALDPSLRLVPRETAPLGVGDHARFSDRDYAHRCRNLSAQRPALTLHVYGGALDRYRTYHKSNAGSWDDIPQRAELELASS